MVTDYDPVPSRRLLDSGYYSSATGGTEQGKYMKVPEETDVVWMESIRTERRSRRRFAIQQPLRGEVLNTARRPIAGVTVNISSNGIQFVAAEKIPTGAAIRIVLAWPVPSDARVELALLARVVRSEGCVIAAQVWSHQFQSLPASAA